MAWEPLPGSGDEPARIDRSVDRILRSLGGPGTDVLTTVFTSWPELVGPELAELATPSALRGRCLTVSVQDPAWAAEVGFRRAGMLERLAAALGPDAVTSIEVRVRR